MTPIIVPPIRLFVDPTVGTVYRRVMNHTNSQNSILLVTNKTIRDMAVEMLSEARQLQDTIVSLPHDNEAGEPVTHGCNERIRDRRDALLSAVRVLSSQIADYRELCLEHNFDSGQLKLEG